MSKKPKGAATAAPASHLGRIKENSKKAPKKESNSISLISKIKARRAPEEVVEEKSTKKPAEKTPKDATEVL